MAKRVWIGIGSALGFALWLSLFLNRAERPNFSDFHVYWVAGGKAAQHLTVYDVEGHYQFKYSPFVALLWALPTLFRSDYLWGRLHYIATGIGWYVLLFWLARKVDAKRVWPLWAAACAVFSVAIRDELKLGQVNLWPFLLVLPAWFYGRRAPESRGFDATGFWIGAAWGLAVQWKLYALLLGPLWLLRRRPAVFGGAIAITVLTLGAAMSVAHGVAFTIDENLRWLKSLTASSQELLVSQYNVSILGILGKAGNLVGLPFGVWAYAVWFAVLLLGLGALAWSEHFAHTSRDALRWFWPASFVWALVAIVNPLVWPYWQLLVVPLFLIHVAHGTALGVRHARPAFWAVLATFTAMNWLQNYPIVHYGGGLAALLLLLADAYRQERGNGGAESRVSPLPAAAPNA